MRSFVREKQIDCGKHYKEVDIFPYTEDQQNAAAKKKRAKKSKESPPKQKNLNDKNACRYFIQLMHLNFEYEPGALHISLTYSPKYLPETMEDAEKEAGKYIRRLKYMRKKEGLPPLKYILVTACTMKKKSDKPVRIHHHLVINGGLERDAAEELWRRPRRKGQKQGDRIGYCNADRLQAEEDGIGALSHYLVKQAGGKKRWSSSHNLKRPSSRTNDRKYTRRQVEKWAKQKPDCTFWEKRYPGWTLTNEDYGAQYEYNELTGWSIYLKLRRKE